MAESNPTQVILTDDGLKIIKAQNTADEAAGNINDINSDNKLTPSEKIKLKQEYDKDVELYNIDTEQLKSVDLPTAELETAMSNLTDFVTPLLKEMNITSTINRDTLNSVFTTFATADKNASQAFVNMVQQVADDAKKAGDDAKEAGEKAQEAGEDAQASANQAQTDATQAKADAATAQQKAQSSIDQLNAHLPDIDNASAEIDQLKNAIKLKADSTDVTSQINVAIKGVQTDVTNKVSDLNTKVSQTDSAWRASVSTLGITNMVYNGGFAHGVDGWDTQNGKWAWSNQAQDQVQGNNSIQAIFTGLTTDTWNNAASKPFLVRPGQKMSIGAIVTPWVLDSDSTKGFGIGLEFFASQDGTGTRNDYHPEQLIYTTGRHQLKVENITVPNGVNSARVRLFIQRNGGANFTCVQANMTPTLPQFIDGFATATDITASINNINLKVSNSDGSSSQVNINNNTILLDANKIILNGNTSIQNGTIGTAKIANAAINTAQIADGAINNAKIANASIDDAKINNLNGNKIIAGTITSKQLNADDIIANVINGKTINGITINTPNLNLGTNGVLNENWSLNQNTAWFEPKKGVGTTTLDMGVLRMNGNLSRWWNGDGSDQYWYGIANNGDKIKNGSNVVTDDYAPGYEKHDIIGSDGSVLLRSYLDATGLYLNQNSTKTVMVALTQKGLDTGGYIHAQQNSVVDQWFDAGVNTGTGIRIGYRAIQAHGSNDIYFNTDSTVGALTLHAKNFSSSSQLSRKKDISPLEEEQAMETIMNTDIYRYHYKDETESEPYNYSVIIDDIHEKPQYKTPEEFIIADRTGRNDGNAVGFLIQALKNANRRILALEEIINEGKE